MAVLNNKIDFVAIVSVTNANPNGDPLGGNRPRTDYEGYGEMSDVCIKRKLRNRMQDLGNDIFVQSDDRTTDDCETLAKRAEGAGLKSIKTEKELFEKACGKWLDVRSFGQLFAFNNLNVKSLGIRGPVSIHHAVSAAPVQVVSMQITKSVSGEKKDGSTRGSDTMGTKHFIRFGAYTVKGSINVQLAEKTGFTEQDAETIKECLRTLFLNDSSSARPDGSMEVVRLYWFRHNCKDGQYSSAKVHRSVKLTLKDEIRQPRSMDDFEITLQPLDGLTPEIIEGL